MINKTIKIFGYGSLINEESLKKTSPNSKIIYPAKIYGFIRVFNLPSTNRICPITKTSVAVLNVEKSEYNEHINGVCIEVSVDEFEYILEREKGYELIEIEIQDYNNENNRTKGFMFRARHYEAYDYVFESEIQQEYLTICLEGAKNFGEQFLKEFKNTTFIGTKTLDELNI